MNGRIVAASAMLIGLGIMPVRLASADETKTTEIESPFSLTTDQDFRDPFYAGSEKIDFGGGRADGCPCHEPRKTLFRWKDGANSGGPPGPDEPLVTDRPDFTEASVTVGRGVAQLEFGYTYVFDDDGDESFKAHSVGEPLLRLGMLAEWLELRLAWTYLEETTSAPGERQLLIGSSDLLLGLKIALTPQEGILPEMALIPQILLPTGTSELSANEVLPGLNWLYSWQLSERLSFGGSTQGNGVLDDATGKGYLEIAQSLTTGLSFTERLGMYAEWFAFFPHNANTARPRHFFNSGLTFLLSNDVQFDIRAGLGLNDAADDFFSGTGLSIRF